MKQIVAIVKPFLAERVLKSLERAPLEALNVREVKGFSIRTSSETPVQSDGSDGLGRQDDGLDQDSQSEYSHAFLTKVEISMWVDDARVDEIVRSIVETARTGRIGDGKIFVLPLAVERELTF